ncbi:hypothetical protein [Nocardioides nitrophenolicus]|uniref:hypothetical protein n=1 Tax=Nocardioides nitrophenolicus TaxID=60489 RepID=UPI00195D0406|nr:hypothetical protein [Nocardioides nitrophenolicus]MBM7518264.1 hypothetical protein [Nocardioides nitrophenolicus]
MSAAVAEFSGRLRWLATQLAVLGPLAAVAPSLDVFHGNIAGRRKVRRIRRRMRKHKDDVLILTEAYNARPYLKRWAERFGYELRHATRAKHGPEGPDVAVLVRHGIEILDYELVEMTKEWWGPFRYPHSRKKPRLVPVLTLRKAGMIYVVIGMHAPSGGPKGGTSTRGRNAPAWAEYADHVRHVLTGVVRGAAVGDGNAKGAELREHMMPADGQVAMASGVDGVVAKGLRIALRRLRSPLGMHGWFRARLTPIAN